ncbi:MAG: hypothetical protein ABIH21_04985 [Patescibacteria group bacterium]
MDFVNKYNFKTSNVLKVAGIAIVAIIVIVFAFRMIGTSLVSIFNGNKIVSATNPSVMQMDSYGYAESAGLSMGSSKSSVSLSARNVAPSGMPIYDEGVTSSNDAEAYEVAEFSGSIKTRDLDETCGTILDLKVKDNVIFESANQSDKSCYFRFKVEKASVEEILEVINSLNPEELSESVYTIKNQIEDYTSEEEILLKKKESIDETLTKAISSYDMIATVATQAHDAESLAKIIDSKINIIERLTNDRINVNAQLDRLGRDKALQLDRLDYTYFSISVSEVKYIDGKYLKDSWRNALRNFVLDINRVVQDISINLVGVLFVVLQYAIYLTILLVVAKYGWKFARYIWKK